jgi:hypothetical protein
MAVLKATLSDRGDVIVQRRGRAEKIVRTDICQVKKSEGVFRQDHRIVITYQPRQHVLIGFGSDLLRRDAFFEQLLG